MTYSLAQTNITRDAFVKRMVYLAYKASRVVGMGCFQEKSNATEDEVIQEATGNFGLSADYVFGRMVKLNVDLSDNPHEFSFPDTNPRRDYQSWADTYESYSALVNATAESFIQYHFSGKVFYKAS